MNQSLEWRLARTFVRCYSLVLFISLIQAIFGPFFSLFMTNYANSPEEMWKIRATAISGLCASLAVIVILWRYSDRIANKLAVIHDGPVEAERIDFPFDVGVGLAGLIFLVDGLKALAGEAAAWYFSKSDTFPYNRPPGIVDVRHLAVYSAETIIGLVLFVGAKTLLQGILKLRGMPPSTGEQVDD